MNIFLDFKKYQRFENSSHKIDLIVHRTHTNKALGLSLIIQQSNSMMTSILMVCLGKGGTTNISILYYAKLFCFNLKSALLNGYNGFEPSISMGRKGGE